MILCRCGLKWIRKWSLRCLFVTHDVTDSQPLTSSQVNVWCSVDNFEKRRRRERKERNPELVLTRFCRALPFFPIAITIREYKTSQAYFPFQASVTHEAQALLNPAHYWLQLPQAWPLSLCTQENHLKPWLGVLSFTHFLAHLNQVTRQDFTGRRVSSICGN